VVDDRASCPICAQSGDLPHPEAAAPQVSFASHEESNRHVAAPDRARPQIASMVMADTDNDAGAGHEAAWQAWFVPEREAQEAALAAPPGKEHHERFDALNRAVQIFSKNGQELFDHLAKFIGTDQQVHELDEGFSQETVRLLHNYLASVGSLRDMQRSIHHRLWPQRAEHDKPTNTKTAWEVNVYNPRTEFMFGDDAIQFQSRLHPFHRRRSSAMHLTPPGSATTQTPASRKFV
jgi:hypothetical protein